MPSIQSLTQATTPIKTGASAIYKWNATIARQFVLKSPFGDEPTNLYRENNGFLELPRAVCPVGHTDARTLGEPAHFPKEPIPRPYQTEVFNTLDNMIEAGQSGLAVCYTGWGKTVAGYRAAWKCQRKTLVITTKEDIFDQWVRDAPTFLGIEPWQVGEIRQDKCEIIGTKICVALIQSLSKEGRYPEWIYDTFGLVIFDECHRLPAEHFSKVAWMFPAMWRLGLSATPERRDGKELMLHAHLGPIRAKSQLEMLVPKILRFKTDWECPRHRKKRKDGETVVVKLPHQAGKCAHVERILHNNEKRNALIAEGAKEAHAKGRKHVLFSTTHAHLALLHRAMVAAKVPGKDIGYYIGATTKAAQEANEETKQKPVVLTTYSMMAEGTNWPWLDTCSIAGPRSDVRQCVGRIRREFDGKSDGVVFDYVDEDSPVFWNYAAKRLDWYQSINCVIKDMG